MNKKSIVIIVLIILVLSSCKSQASKNYNQKVEKETKIEEVKEEPIQENPIQIVAEYTLPDNIGWYTDHIIIIKNISKKTVDVLITGEAYNDNGIMLGEKVQDKFIALGAGCTSLFWEAYKTDEKIASYDNSIEIPKAKDYESIIQDLEIEQKEIIENTVEFKITNKGKNKAEYVKGNVLFFDNDKLVDFKYKYFDGGKIEIEPNQSVTNKFSSSKKFDRVEIYIEGRKDIDRYDF